jgi:predicted helicase
VSQQLVQQFLNDLDRLKKLSGSLNEQTVREAFKDLLKAWARQADLLFVAELEFATPQKTTVKPDGTILHDLRVPLGYWESKDTKDSLDAEIEKKLRKGYPQDNIIFENSDEAVLWQDRREAFRTRMSDIANLLKLLDLFFGHERPEIAEFRKAILQFKSDLPHVLDALRDKIDAAYAGNVGFQAAAKKFLAHVKETVNPTLAEADVREMLIQHILTEEIFTQVFNDGQFHRENNIARELYALEGAFFTGAVKRDTLKSVERYYATIRANAALITGHHEKQSFLKAIYEDFYKVYNPKAADRLGVVYTPNEIVRFMIEGADWLCQKHFGRALIDRDVEILDPAAGTGTFVCELIEHFRGQAEKLRYKYKNELHANEVAILPYYVANLNIEATYAAVSGQYAEFENLCFVDTLDNVAGLGIKAGHQADLFGALSEENVERVKRQNRRKISVIIGNPPYNANQQNENDNNKNREYKRIDELIKASYIRRSTAQKTKLYDMYARFFRWASDRLHDDGVLAFITNRSFIDGRTFDGFRRCVADEFAEIYVIDLGGDVRADPRISGTKNNVFGIQTGVAISLMVKRRGAKGCKIFHVNRPPLDTRDDKLTWLSGNPASRIKFWRIEPDKNANWINLTENDWDDLIPVADKKTKAAKTIGQEKAIFRLHSLGIATNRDEWSFDYSRPAQQRKSKFFADVYAKEVSRWAGIPDSKLSNKSHLKTALRKFVDRSIKWTEELEWHLHKGTSIEVADADICEAHYRPFVAMHATYAPVFTHRTYQQDSIFPLRSEKENYLIAISGQGASKKFQALISDKVPSLDFLEKTQCLPRHRYSKSGEKIDNITDWALARFREAYGEGGEHSPSPLRGGVGGGGRARSAPTKNTPTGSVPALPGQSPASPQGGGKSARPITKDAIFHYVYGVLHDPVYREKYAINLKREFPRIPFYPDFWKWAEWGEKLIALHIGYETVEPWPLKRTDAPDVKARAAGVAPKAMLKADKDNGQIRLDSETALSGVPNEVWDYKLGNRSGLEWILDQYKEKTPKDPTIREKFNTYRFADYKKKVIDLLMRVTRVSVETVAITQAMKGAKR